jgi:hypothetical protein
MPVTALYVKLRNAVACGDLSRSLVPSTAATSPSTTLIPRAVSCSRCWRSGRGAVREQGHIGPPLTPHRCLCGGFPARPATSRLRHSQHSWRSGLIASLVPVIFDRSPAHLRRRWLSVTERPATFACQTCTAHSMQDESWPSAEPRAHWLAFFIESANGELWQGLAVGRRRRGNRQSAHQQRFGGVVACAGRPGALVHCIPPFAWCGPGSSQLASWSSRADGWLRRSRVSDSAPA